MLKLDGSGNVLWQKTYGGTGGQIASSITPTSDGGYVVAGYTYGFGAGNSDAWVLKLDANGNIGVGCSVIGASSATITNTTATVANSSATTGNSTATGVPSSASVNNTNAQVSTQCGK